MLSEEEMRRYSRHIVLPEVGMERQKKIRKASLHRQIIYITEDAGKSKTKTSKKRLLDINRNVDVIVHDALRRKCKGHHLELRHNHRRHG